MSLHFCTQHELLAQSVERGAAPRAADPYMIYKNECVIQRALRVLFVNRPTFVPHLFSLVPGTVDQRLS
jgi:hypothetical protein